MSTIPLDDLLAESTIAPCTFEFDANADDDDDDDDDGAMISSNSSARTYSSSKSKSSSENASSPSARLSSEANIGPIDCSARENLLSTPSRASDDFTIISVYMDGRHSFQKNVAVPYTLQRVSFTGNPPSTIRRRPVSIATSECATVSEDALAITSLTPKSVIRR